MKKVHDYADQYIQESDWKVIAALKLCLLSWESALGCPAGEKKNRCSPLRRPCSSSPTSLDGQIRNAPLPRRQGVLRSTVSNQHPIPKGLRFRPLGRSASLF